MNWIPILILLVAVVAFVLLRRAGQISASGAADYLKSGAMVIDVRSAGEFTSGHLRQAVNMPLSEIESLIARKVTDKNQVLLLHCQTGARSATARKKLVALGYTRAFNLGSYSRAASIMGRV